MIQAQNDLEKQRIALARVIGLPVRQKFSWSIVCRITPVPDISLTGAYDLALQTRSDYKAAQAQLRAAELRKVCRMEGTSSFDRSSREPMAFSATSLMPWRRTTPPPPLSTFPSFQGGQD